MGMHVVCPNSGYALAMLHCMCTTIKLTIKGHVQNFDARKHTHTHTLTDKNALIKSDE